MKRKKNRRRDRNRMAAFLAAMVLMAFCLCQAAFAAESAGIDPARPVSLTLDLETQTKQATFALYQAGTWDGRLGMYVLTGEFASSGAALSGMGAGGEGMSTDELLETSRKLEQFAHEHGIIPAASGTTREGRIRFEGLADGLYLLVQERGSTDNVTINPFFITLPVWDEIAGVWDYEAEAYPKNEADQPGPSPGGGNGGNGGGGGGRGDRTPGGGGDPATIGDPDTALANLENISDEDVPLATNPILDTIEDLLVPLGLLPRTADGSVSYTPLLAIMAASGLLIILLVKKRGKPREQR